MLPIKENCYYCPCFAKCIDIILSGDVTIRCAHFDHMKKWVEETAEKLGKITIPSITDADVIRELVYSIGRTGPKSKVNNNDIIAPVSKCASCLKRYRCTYQEEYNCKKNDYSMYEVDMSSKWL